ncbi:MAG: rod shape-determining protein MreC [Actinobacteria bacterium]|nr:rod shape-determining protein MreC [Actinomycetota bacterium]
MNSKKIRNIIVLIVIIFLCLLVITISFRETGLLQSIKSGVLDIFIPVQERIFYFFSPVTGFLNTIRDYIDLRDKYLELEKENAALRKDYNENISLKIENDMLRDLLGMEIREEHETIPAKVIGFYESEWQSEITLNMGKNSGVLEGMGVINEEGLIGIVISSSNKSCNVRLLNDPGSSIGARVVSSRVLGMVEGNQDRKVYMNYVPADEEIFKGDMLVTSEFGEFLPPEILIGRIRKVSEIPGDPYLQIEVETFVDFRELEYVLIIKE